MALSNPDRDLGDTHWILFVVLSTLLGVAGGESFDFAAARWREIATRHHVQLRHVTPTVLSVIGVAVGLIAATPHFVGKDGLTCGVPRWPRWRWWAACPPRQPSARCNGCAGTRCPDRPERSSSC